jgi:membrane associated rhomboid family serine protease
MFQRMRGGGGGGAALQASRAATILYGLEVGLSLVWLMCSLPTRMLIVDWLGASTTSVLREGHVWALATSPFLETSFVALLLHGVMVVSLLPMLERFWGTPRFVRFFAITAVVGGLGGCAAGLVVPEVLVSGFGVFMYAAVVAFGIVYAKTPMQFFGVLPLTGRQMMYGFLGFLTLFVVLEGHWALGAAHLAGIAAAVVMTSKRWNPGLAFRRWQIARARAHLGVVPPTPSTTGGGPSSKKKKTEERWLN